MNPVITFFNKHTEREGGEGRERETEREAERHRDRERVIDA